MLSCLLVTLTSINTRLARVVPADVAGNTLTGSTVQCYEARSHRTQLSATTVGGLSLLVSNMMAADDREEHGMASEGVQITGPWVIATTRS